MWPPVRGRRPLDPPRLPHGRDAMLRRAPEGAFFMCLYAEALFSGLHTTYIKSLAVQVSETVCHLGQKQGGAVQVVLRMGHLDRAPGRVRLRGRASICSNHLYDTMSQVYSNRLYFLFVPFTRFFTYLCILLIHRAMDINVLPSFNDELKYMAPISRVIRVSVQDTFLINSPNPGKPGDYDSDEDIEGGEF